MASADRLHDAVFSEMTYHAAYQPQRAVRTERWKYIRRFDDSERPVLANCDDSASKQLLVEHGWAEQRLATEQLYDLVFDPSEGRNVAAEPANAAVLDGASRAPRRLDGRARRPAARRPGGGAPGRRDQRPEPGLAGRPDDDRHGGSHGRAIQVRQRHSRSAGVERRRPAAPVLEGAQAAVQRAQLPQPPRLSGAELARRADSWTKKKRRKIPWLTASTRSAPVLEQLRLDPLDAGDISANDSAPAGAKPGSSPCSAIQSDQRRSRCSSPESSRSRRLSRSSRRSSRTSISSPSSAAIGAAVCELAASGLTTGASAEVGQVAGRQLGLIASALGEPVAAGVGQVATGLRVGDRFAMAQEMKASIGRSVCALGDVLENRRRSRARNIRSTRTFSATLPPV